MVKWVVTGYGCGLYSEHRSARAAWRMAFHEMRLERRIGLDARVIMVRVLGAYACYTLDQALTA